MSGGMVLPAPFVAPVQRPGSGPAQHRPGAVTGLARHAGHVPGRASSTSVGVEVDRRARPGAVDPHHPAHRRRLPGRPLSGKRNMLMRTRVAISTPSASGNRLQRSAWTRGAIDPARCRASPRTGRCRSTGGMAATSREPSPCRCPSRARGWDRGAGHLAPRRCSLSGACRPGRSRVRHSAASPSNSSVTFALPDPVSTPVGVERDLPGDLAHRVVGTCARRSLERGDRAHDEGRRVTGIRSAPLPGADVDAELLHAVDDDPRVEGRRGPVVVPHPLVARGLHEHGRLLDREQHPAPAHDALVALSVVSVEHEVHRVALVDDVVVVPVPGVVLRCGQHGIGVRRCHHSARLAGEAAIGGEAARAVASSVSVAALERRHPRDRHRLHGAARVASGSRRRSTPRPGSGSSRTAGTSGGCRSGCPGRRRR